MSIVWSANIWKSWFVKKTHEKGLVAAEMSMLKWSVGKTWTDIIRGMAKVIEVLRKIQEWWLQWIHYEKWRQVLKAVCQIQMEGRRRIGRPRKRLEEMLWRIRGKKRLCGDDGLDKSEWRRMRNSVTLPQWSGRRRKRLSRSCPFSLELIFKRHFGSSYISRHQVLHRFRHKLSRDGLFILIAMSHYCRLLPSKICLRYPIANCAATSYCVVDKEKVMSSHNDLLTGIHWQ